MRHPAWLVPLFLAIALAASGCVLAGTHEEVLSERDSLAASKRALEEKVRLLDLANRSLDVQVAELLDSSEDLLLERTGLQSDLATTRGSAAKLTQALRARETELAATAAALTKQAERVAELEGVYEGLVSDLEAEVAAGQIRIEQLAEGLQVGVSDDILFASGSATLSAEGIATLETVAARLANLAYEIDVQGHTDDLSVSADLAKRYPSNWELAGARASRVVRLFVDAGIDPVHIAAISYGPFRPLGANDTVEGRSMNRRIEIRLKPLREAPTVDATPEVAEGGSPS